MTLPTWLAAASRAAQVVLVVTTGFGAAAWLSSDAADAAAGSAFALRGLALAAAIVATLALTRWVSRRRAA